MQAAFVHAAGGQWRATQNSLATRRFVAAPFVKGQPPRRARRCGAANRPTVPSVALFPSGKDSRHGRSSTVARRASGSTSPGSGAGGDPYAEQPNPAEETGSEEWRKRPSALSLPKALQSPGAWFVLAGALKVLFLMYANTPVSYMVTVFGSPLLGTMLTALPAAVGLGLLAKTIVEKEYHKRRFFVPIALLATLLFCLVCNAFIEPTVGSSSQPSIKATSTVTRTVSSSN